MRPRHSAGRNDVVQRESVLANKVASGVKDMNRMSSSCPSDANAEEYMNENLDQTQKKINIPSTIPKLTLERQQSS